MVFKSWDKPEAKSPFVNGGWDKDKLYEYLVRRC